MATSVVIIHTYLRLVYRTTDADVFGLGIIVDRTAASAIYECTGDISYTGSCIWMHFFLLLEVIYSRFVDVSQCAQYTLLKVQSLPHPDSQSLQR